MRPMLVACSVVGPSHLGPQPKKMDLDPELQRLLQGGGRDRRQKEG